MSPAGILGSFYTWFLSPAISLAHVFVYDFSDQRHEEFGAMIHSESRAIDIKFA